MDEIKTFRASSMQEALALVRRELGMEAVILHTRQVRQRRLLPFLKAKEEVEITAGLEPRKAVAAVAEVSAPVTTRTTSAPVATLPEPEPEEPLTGVARAARIAAELERRHAEKQKLETSMRSIERLTGAKCPTPSDDDVAWVGTPLKAPPSRRQSHSPATTRTLEAKQQPVEAAPVEPPPRRGTGRQSVRAEREPVMTPTNRLAALKAESAPAPVVPVTDQAAHLVAAMATATPTNSAVSELASKLDALQSMVESLTRSTQHRGHDEIPAELFDIYTQLIDADIENDLARELIFRLRSACTIDQLQDQGAARAMLSRLVENDIVCSAPIRPTPGRRKVIALVGPTGVGKTTTIAKLAANFRLRDGVKIGLVTVDTYRIAAVEQLRTYAEIIDLPMKVVTSPQEMRRALDELVGLDLVLIDTAGRSPRDEMKIQELKQMVAEAGVDEIHLVMSLTASLRNLRTTAEQFRPVGPTAVVLTKLDEAAGMGCLLSLSKQLLLPLSYVTTGQDVPDDIEPANATRLARLVLGQDRLFE